MVEKKRNESFKNWQPVACWVAVATILIVGFILFYLLNATNVFTDHQAIIQAILYTIPFVFTGTVAVAIFLMNTTAKRRADFYNKWENEPQNSNYKRLIKENEDIKTELQKIDEQINSLMS